MMTEEVIVEEDRVLIFDDSELDPDGNPLVIEMTLEEYNNGINNILGEQNGKYR